MMSQFSFLVNWFFMLKCHFYVKVSNMQQKTPSLFKSIICETKPNISSMFLKGKKS